MNATSTGERGWSLRLVPVAVSGKGDRHRTCVSFRRCAVINRFSVRNGLSTAEDALGWPALSTQRHGALMGRAC